MRRVPLPPRPARRPPGGRGSPAVALAVRLLLVAVVPTWAAPAAARDQGSLVRGKVLQTTLHDIFVDIGAAQGLRVGDQVSVRLANRSWKACQVTAVSSRRARLAAPDDGHLPREGASARARVAAREPPTSAAPKATSTPVVARRAGDAVRLPEPEPVARLRARWRGVSRDRPRLIGFVETTARAEPRAVDHVQGFVRAEYLATLNLGAEEPRNYHQLAVSSSLDVPHLIWRWLDYSHSMRVAAHLARDLDARRFQDSRPVLSVYRLRLGLHLARLRAELGRMAAAPLPAASTIDGTTVRAQVTPWLHLGGFGGLLPHGDDLRPGTQGTSFGSYAALRLGHDGTGRRWLLHADLGFVGSTWRGELDRRALSARVRYNWSRLLVTANTEVNFYEEGHPSGLSGVDLGSLNLAVDGRVTSWLRLGSRFDQYRFVPSREALELYGPLFVSTGSVTSARGSADLRLGRWSDLSLYGGADHLDGDSWVGWGEVMVQRRGLWDDAGRARLSATSHYGTLLTSFGGRLAYLHQVTGGLSLGGSYGLSRDSYGDGEVTDWRHRGSLSGEATLGDHWLLVLDSAVMTSDIDDLLQLFATVGYVF